MNDPENSDYKETLTFEDVLEMLEDAACEDDDEYNPYVPLDFHDETESQ